MAPFFFADLKGIEELEVGGDSKVVVDWVNGRGRLQSLDLDNWKQKIGNLKNSFSDLQVKHIFREYNSVADNLSKQALKLVEGKLFIVEYDRDVKI